MLLDSLADIPSANIEGAGFLTFIATVHSNYISFMLIGSCVTHLAFIQPGYKTSASAGVAVCLSVKEQAL